MARLQTTFSALSVVERLVRDYRVAVIPGEAFGLVDACYVRIAFGALRQDTVAIGMDRLVDGLEKLLPPLSTSLDIKELLAFCFAPHRVT